ncbi:hypothetical protein EJ08DRAFT_331749 [Tothia fuscella]|uniref:Spindle pole body component n=1 Tax=Tothia fuscella TaxID=1048955 RepID=A0A9P4NM55_9PEZI|nr:hypothetical protein EJ08DRAFT_331749 [Tothia fuscella]
MLHEILLSLSGHPSALFPTQSLENGTTSANIDFPLLSPPEQALLKSIGQLSRLHRDIRSHASAISAQHPSTICRAVATAITTIHLARFQRKILEVEEGILRKDARSVGAYNIVPLAGVVGEFDEWTRLMEWFWRTVCLIQDPNGARTCSGVAIIDRLRQEAQTGYPDVEQAALDLGKVAEAAWLRQLSTWLLYGKLPAFGAEDFFVHKVDDVEFEADAKLLPKYVTPSTASSILFIGKSLNHIRIRGTAEGTPRRAGTELDLLPIHLKHLSTLALPISSSALSSAVASIRLSLSRNTLQQLLPLPKIINLLTIFRDYFLLGKGEFAVSLITTAEAHLQSRNKNTGPQSTTKGGLTDSLRGLVIKEAELTTILSKTFSTLSSLVEDDSTDAESLDFARGLFRLTTAKSSNITKRASNNKSSPPTFNDFLLPIPTTLTMELKSPYDLFATSAELGVYSNLHSYLLSIRRAHMRLGDLWRQTQLRRVHPAPLGPPLSCSEHGLKVLEIRRARARKRNADMRGTWATCSAAVFLLGEMGNYFEGEVVGGAWGDLREWISPVMANVEEDDGDGDENTATANKPRHHDPETLSSAHRTFLSTLTHTLLLTDLKFTKVLRELLQHIDGLVSLLHRLQSTQSNMDLEEDEGIVDVLSNSSAEEYDSITKELGRARSRVDSGLKSVVARLRELDGSEERVHVGSESLGGDGGEGGEGYRGWRGGGVERLLMRLDVHYGHERDEEDGGNDLV